MYEEIGRLRGGRVDRLHDPRRGRRGLPASGQRPGRQGRLAGDPFALLSTATALRPQPERRAAGSVPPEAAHPRQAPAHLGLSHHEFQAWRSSKPPAAARAPATFAASATCTGRSFRPFPIERILADIDEIYHKQRLDGFSFRTTIWCWLPNGSSSCATPSSPAGIAKLHFVVQADCVSMSRNEEMVRKMAQAGIKTVFLGIENASKKNLRRPTRATSWRHRGRPCSCATSTASWWSAG